MSDIFISHVEEDEAIALDIAAGLEAAGYSCWYYERDGLPGVRYLVQIDKAIEQAQAIVVVISRDSLSSSQVDAEVERAHESAKHFIPILRGIKHVEFQNRKPVWRMAMGTATSLPIPVEGVSAIITRIVAGAQELGIERHANQVVKSRDVAVTELAESPERKGLQVLSQEKESMDSNSSIAAPEMTAKTLVSSMGETPRHDNELSNDTSLFDQLLKWSLGRRKPLAVVAVSFVLLLSVLLIFKHYRSAREQQKKSPEAAAAPANLPTDGKGRTTPTAVDGSTMSASHDLSAPKSYDAEIVFENGQVIKNAELSCGPRGWSSYVASIEYTKDLEVIKTSEYGPRSGNFIGFDKISRLEFLEMNEEERYVIDQNPVYREWIRKSKLTFTDGTVWNNVYLLDHCIFKTNYEAGHLYEMRPKTISIKLKN